MLLPYSMVVEVAVAAAAAVVDAEAVDAEAAARARRARHTLFELVHRVSSTKRSKIRYCTGTGNALTPFRILFKVKLPQAFAPTRQVVNKWRARLHTDCGPQLKSTIPWIRCGRLKGLHVLSTLVVELPGIRRNPDRKKVHSFGTVKSSQVYT